MNKYFVLQDEVPKTNDSILGIISNAQIQLKIDLKQSFGLIILVKECGNYTGSIYRSYST